jgi:hypothetical protein
MAECSSGQVCCDPASGGTPGCQPAGGSCAGVSYACDGPEDCQSGQVCCLRIGNVSGTASCTAAADCQNTQGAPLCHSAADCPDQQECCPGPGKGGQFMVCEVGCPISQREKKRDIRYLGDDDRARLHEQMMALRLATYRYRVEGETAPEHLGFIIDDLGEGAACVQPDGQHVDLYGYTSMAVAALQVQARQIETLKAEIASLKQVLKPTLGARAKAVGSR